jgi:hypothetical protein
LVRNINVYTRGVDLIIMQHLQCPFIANRRPFITRNTDDVIRHNIYLWQLLYVHPTYNAIRKCLWWIPPTRKSFGVPGRVQSSLQI